MFNEFPKALTNAHGEQIIVADAGEEAEGNKDGFYFGGPPKAEPKPRKTKGKE